MTEQTIVPVLPLRDVVVYPHMVIPLFVGRQKSVKALEQAMDGGKQIVLVAQKSAADDNPDVGDLHWVGTLSNILQLLKLPDGTIKVLVEGVRRARILAFTETERLFNAKVEFPSSDEIDPREVEVLRRTLLEQFDQYVKLNKRIPAEILATLSSIDDPERLGDTIAAHLSIKLEQKQKLLEITDLSNRLEQLVGVLESELDLLQVQKRLRGRVKRQMEKSQREYYLNEQMKAIQKELGDLEEGGSELDELARTIGKAGMPKEAKDRALAELKKLKMMSPMSAEATVVRNYVDWMVSVPWKKRTEDQPGSHPGGIHSRGGSLRAGKGEGTDPGIPCRAAAGQEIQRPHPMLGGSAGRGQDLARAVARARDQPHLRAHVAGRRTRRGGDPRPPAHLCRFDAG